MVPLADTIEIGRNTPDGFTIGKLNDRYQSEDTQIFRVYLALRIWCEEICKTTYTSPL
jgi:hypothetical protein